MLATVLFTDIVGSSDIAVEMGDARWKELLRRHHALIRTELRRFGGHEIDTAGDGFFATFPRPADAIRCACAAGERIRSLGIEIRAGLHAGEVEISDGKASGIVVHTGARVASLAGAGVVLITGTVKDLAAGMRMGLKDHGTTRLKGIPGEWPLFEVMEVDGRRRSPPLAPDEAARARESVEVPPVFDRHRRKLVGAGFALVLVLIGIWLIRSWRSSPPPQPRAVEPPINSVVEIDPVTKKPVATVSGLPIETFEAARPKIAVGEGGVWVLDATTVLHVDPTRNVLESRIRVKSATPGTPALVAIAVGERGVWVTSQVPTAPDLGALAIIDPATNQKVRTITFRGTGDATGIAIAERSVWESFDDGSVLRIDPRTYKVVTRIRAGIADLLAVGEGAVWVANRVASTVMRIDPETYQASIPISVAGTISGIAVGEDYIWVLESSAGTVIPIDSEDGLVGQPVRVGGDPTDIAAGLGAVWVSDRSEGAVYRIDPSTKKVTTIMVGSPLRAVAVDEAAETLWVLVSE
jgi:streptogramin lyase